MSLVSSATQEPRLNWHPQVHREFDEDLYYVAIRFTQSLSVSAQVADLMERAGLHYFCAYTISGYYDALLRFWATPQYRRRLLRALADRKMDVLSVREFQASELFYSWASESGLADEDLLASTSKNELIKSLTEVGLQRVNDVALNASSPPRGNLGAMINEALLIPKPSESGHLLKVIILLQPYAQVGDDNGLSERLYSRMRNLQNNATVSFYAGNGDLARYVVRCSVDSFDRLEPLMREMDDIIGPLALRTMTFPLISVIGVESDNINNVYRLTSDEHRFAELIGVSLSNVERMMPHSRQKLMALVSFINSHLDKPDPAETAIKVVRAIILEDRLSLREALSFIVDFEYYFRLYAANLFRELFLRDWLSVLLTNYDNLFKSLSADAAANFDRWPLGVVHSAMIQVTRNNNVARGIVNSQLGEDWASVSRSMLNLRNPFAHGRLIRDIKVLNDLDGEWGDQVAQAIEGMQMFSALYNVTEEEDNQ